MQKITFSICIYKSKRDYCIDFFIKIIRFRALNQSYINLIYTVEFFLHQQCKLSFAVYKVARSLLQLCVSNSRGKLVSIIEKNKRHRPIISLQL